MILSLMNIELVYLCFFMLNIFSLFFYISPTKMLQGPGPDLRVRTGQCGLTEGAEAVLDQPEGGRTHPIRLQGQGDIRGERYIP